MAKDVGKPTQPEGRTTLSSSFDNWKPRLDGVDSKKFSEKINDR
jgi:hypothetical protein